MGYNTLGGEIVLIEDNNIVPFKDDFIRFCVHCTHVKLSELANGLPVIKQHSVISLKNRLSSE